MTQDRTIRETIQHLAGTHQTDRVTMVDAEVNSVDQNNRICDCTAITGPVGSDIPNVRLMSSVDDGLLILPAVGSTVTVLLSIFCDPVIICHSEIDKIIFRGGDLNGMVMVSPLTAKLNNIEKIINDLVTKYNAHVHPVVSVGSPTGPTSQMEPDSLTITKQSDIENPSITQG